MKSNLSMHVFCLAENVENKKVLIVLHDSDNENQYPLPSGLPHAQNHYQLPVLAPPPVLPQPAEFAPPPVLPQAAQGVPAPADLVAIIKRGLETNSHTS